MQHKGFPREYVHSFCPHCSSLECRLHSPHHAPECAPKALQKEKDLDSLGFTTPSTAQSRLGTAGVGLAAAFPPFPGGKRQRQGSE